MNVIYTLRRLAGIPVNDVQAAATALAEVERELATASADLSASESTFGERLVFAMGEGAAKAQAVETDLEGKRRTVERLSRAREAVASRLQAAQDAISAAELAKRWDAAEQALRARSEALARFARSASETGIALVAAEDAARAAYLALPIKPAGGPRFLALENELSGLFSLATEGKAGAFRSSMLFDLKRRPGLVERAEAEARELLRVRPAIASPEPPPEAA